MVIPQIWLYLNSQNGGDVYFLALVCAGFAYGEVLGSFLFSYFNNTFKFKVSLFASLSIGFLGSNLYWLAGFNNENSKKFSIYLILLARICQGIAYGG